jgi:dTDP-4-dehydrorhamnose 3,5-epimerase
MKFTPTKLEDVILIEPEVFDDSRGFFMETFHIDKFTEAGLPTEFLQDSHSHSKMDVLRGLHYQAPKEQGKLVRVASGAIYDVVVDIRRGSPTFAAWVGIELNAINNLQLWIPKGFAHGFCVLTETADVIYKMDKTYAAGESRTILWNDTDIGIEWPIETPLVSMVDRQAPPLRDAQHLPEYEK